MHATSQMIVTVVRINAAYTAVSAMAETKFCDGEDFETSISFFIVSFVVGISFMLAYCLLSIKQLQNEGRRYSWLLPLSFVAICYCLPIYILTDNQQPLGCAFGCNNATLNEEVCNGVGKSVFRLTLSIVIFVIISVTKTVPFLWHCRHTNEIYTQEHNKCRRKENYKRWLHV